MLDRIVDWVSGAWWSYPVVFAIAAIDAFFPLVPSETLAITGGVLAASGDLELWLVILMASGGAILGDNISYGIGSWVGEHTVKRVFKSEKAHRGFEWAERQLEERGGYLIVIARFIPGGRTAVTFASGYVHVITWRRFLAYDVVAGLVWGHYTVLLGYFGGRQFEEEPWKGLLLAFGIAVAITVLIEVVRHLRRRAPAA